MSSISFAAFIILFTATGLPPAGALETGGKGLVDGVKTDIEFTEKDVSLEISKKSLLFMLDHLPLSARLARSLGLTDVRVRNLEPGYLFRDTGFKFWLESVTGKNDKRSIEFRYSIGFANPLPVRTTGTCITDVKISAGEGNTALTDIKFSITMNNSAIDKLSRKIPSLLKTVFSLKMEQVLHQAESLAEVINEEPEQILELLEDNGDVFTIADRKAVEKLLGRKLKS